MLIHHYYPWNNKEPFPHEPLSHPPLSIRKSILSLTHLPDNTSLPLRSYPNEENNPPIQSMPPEIEHSSSRQPQNP
jgi:hypothetical protein